jgi:hypothetical protein
MSGGSSSASGANCSNTMIADAILNPFVVHFDNAHLGESPSQQASQASNVDQYTLTHTVLFEQMLAPVFSLVEAAPNGITPFITHFDMAHLEESPSQQVTQASNADQYTRIHTVLAEQMLNPTTQSVTGTYGC